MFAYSITAGSYRIDLCLRTHRFNSFLTSIKQLGGKKVEIYHNVYSSALQFFKRDPTTWVHRYICENSLFSVVKEAMLGTVHTFLPANENRNISGGLTRAKRYSEDHTIGHDKRPALGDITNRDHDHGFAPVPQQHPVQRSVTPDSAPSCHISQISLEDDDEMPFDIDADSANDVLQCPTYAENIMAVLFQREVQLVK